ncbi:terminase [Gemella sp. oral taxon 928]|uniref:PBSX family phage terminase large subunit n=1 Tax=Gemella sp. oral taxon 928 TaxID=1785995 RepID=UPI0007681842|nr:PBSX family phage terminase large subunit [Gemella sp. oral taxon 928]AME09673.1 terminase [Gemella sp. oral taxon 928]
MSKFDVQANINPHFKDVWRSKVPYNVLKGGRNSFKSSVIVLKLVHDMVKFLIDNKKVNIVVIRKVANTIRDSVYNKIRWGIDMYGLTNSFKATVSPFKITHITTGSSFYFYGADDFQKLKSNDISNIIAVWYEEAAEFDDKEEFDQTNITFMRQKHKDILFVKFYWSYNPPRNPYNWINEWSEQIKTDDNYLVHESTYLNDELGFVTEQMLADINRIKENDFDYYRYIYLGEAVGIGNNVYNMNCFHAIKELPSNDRLIGVSFALDTGHQQSATACGAYGITARGNVILLDTFYYSPAGRNIKAAPSDLTVMINEFIKSIQNKYNVNVIRLTIDSAEGALRNQYFKDFGVRWNPVAKKKNQTMIDMVTSLLAQGRFFYLENDNNKIFIEEHKMYRYDEKTIRTDDPKVIKEDDHTVDEFKYFVLDNAKLLGLKV